MKHRIQRQIGRVLGLMIAFTALFFTSIQSFAVPHTTERRSSSSIPNGSYRRSCRHIKIRRHHVVKFNLYATCKNRRGRWIRSKLKNYRRCRGDIVNINGYLRCVPIRTRSPRHRDVSPPHRGIPGGSYRRSCRNIRTYGRSLRATCRTRRGYWNRTRLYNFRRCRRDIANINGRLRCVARRVEHPVHTPHPIGRIPPGSYRRSCRSLRVRGSILRATCRTRSGHWNRTRLYEYPNCRGDIANINGRLRCVTQRHQGPQIPQGSYRHTCRNIRMRRNSLSATCRTRRGYWNRTRLYNFRNCRGEIQNINGRLRCVPLPVSSPGHVPHQPSHRPEPGHQPGHQPERGNSIPQGSYQKTCRQIRIARGSLFASCDTRRGSVVGTVLKNYRHCHGDIANINGHLTCTRSRVVVPPVKPQPPVTNHPVTRLPKGSYKQSCSNIRVVQGNLHASCKTRRGSVIGTVLNNYRHCRADIANINGHLTCVRPRVASPVPQGSYKQTCQNIRVEGSTLFASCRTRRGRMIGTAMADYRRCRHDIANINGQLKCQ